MTKWKALCCIETISDSFHGPQKTAELQLLTLVSSFCSTCNASISLVAVSTTAILYISKVVQTWMGRINKTISTNIAQYKLHVKMCLNGKAHGLFISA
jgi:hypothetical protein